MGGALGRLSAAQRHQLAVLLDTAMLKVRDVDYIATLMPLV